MDRDERHQFMGCLSVVAAFAMGWLGTIVVQHLIHGDEAFRDDAGANFALFVEGTAVGLILAGAALFLSIFFSFRVRRPTQGPRV